MSLFYVGNPSIYLFSCLKCQWSFFHFQSFPSLDHKLYDYPLHPFSGQSARFWASFADVSKALNGDLF